MPNATAGALNTASLYKTGVTISGTSNDDGAQQQGQGVDYYNLDFNNPFGNAKAFTGITGGYQDEITLQYKDVNGVVTTQALAFPSDLVCNWKTYDQVGEKVLVYEITPQTGNTTTIMQNSPYTRNGWGGFYVCNINQLLAIINWGISNDFLDYPPINFPYVDVTDRVMSSTRISGSFYQTYIGNGAQWNQVSAGTYTMFICRETTLTELGL